MIKFWRTSGTYGPFSNFAKFGFVLDGKKWDTTEHFYQAQKLIDPDFQEEVRKAKSAKESKAIAYKYPRRADWEQIKYEVMKKCLLAKFEQNLSLKELLLSTGSEEIAEDSPWDAIWGLGKDGKGKNLLGKALMEIRDILRAV